MGLPGGHCLGQPQGRSGKCSPPWAPVPTLPAQLRRGGGGPHRDQRDPRPGPLTQRQPLPSPKPRPSVPPEVLTSPSSGCPGVHDMQGPRRTRCPLWACGGCPCCAGSVRGCALTCRARREQGHKGPQQRWAPSRGTHSGAGATVRRRPEGVGRNARSPGGPGAYVAGGLGPEPGSQATQGTVIPDNSRVCLLLGRAVARTSLEEEGFVVLGPRDAGPPHFSPPYPPQQHLKVRRKGVGLAEPPGSRVAVTTQARCCRARSR